MERDLVFKGNFCSRIVCCGILLTLTGFIFPDVKGQFPAICAPNATLPDAMCCPTPPGTRELCGGYPRGRCALIQDSYEDYSRAAIETLNDDRFRWPLKFFTYGCECLGNFAGYMCHECRYGYTGRNCDQRIIRVRKDFRKVDPTEKRYIMSLFEKARTTQSDYVLIDVSKGADPVKNVSFVLASVYDYLAHVHYYASRKTIFKPTTFPGNQTDFHCDQPHFTSLDFAHRGTNFPIWHRYYMMVWEKEMQKLAGDISFTFPYWNWTDAGISCEICTDDFLGSHDQNGRISRKSQVSNWYGMCLRESGKCEACDPLKRFPITRTPGRVTSAPRLPTSDTVNFALAQDVYDFPDYTTSVPNASFRGCLEGYVGTPKKDVYRLHNEVHMFFGGILNSATSASWDPIFYFHHSFMDKLLEMWLRRTQAQPTQLPMTGAAPGHHRNSYLMAFYPPVEASLYFRPSEALGYTYDDMIEMPEGTGNDADPPTTEVTSASSVTEKENGAHVSREHDHDHHHQHSHNHEDVADDDDDEYNQSHENHQHHHHSSEGVSEVVTSARLLMLVAVETALLLLLLLVVCSTCGYVLSRRSRGYSRVPSHDYYENGHCPSINHNKISPEIDGYSDSELDSIKI